MVSDWLGVVLKADGSAKLQAAQEGGGDAQMQDWGQHWPVAGCGPQTWALGGPERLAGVL